MRAKAINLKYIIIALLACLSVAVSFAFVTIAHADAEPQASGAMILADESGEEGEEGETPDATAALFVDGEGAPYAIADRVYGDTTAFVVPVLKSGDVDKADYGTESDTVTLALYYGDEIMPVGEGDYNTFTRNIFDHYLTPVMPAGDYRLEMTAGDVIEEVKFTVGKQEIPEDMLKDINAALKGKTFVYEYDGENHLFDEQAKAAVEKALQANAVNVEGTVWSLDKYAALCADLNLSYNLMRLHSDVYYDWESLEIMTVLPDRYVVYYKVDSPNFYSSTEKLGEGEARTDYFFNVEVVRSVPIPVVNDKSYTGELQKADAAGNDIYVVAVNNGGTEAGAYDVVFTFYKPDFYMWEGQTLETKTDSIKVTFRINRAVNDWTDKPAVTGWVAGKYSEVDNAVVGAAEYGTVHIVITNSDDTVVYDNVAGVNHLARARAGVYNLSATVEGTADYNGLSYSVFVRVFDKAGLPWWAILAIVVGVLLIVALVIFILWKKKVFQFLTDKLVLSIRTRATIDATIAAVRAAKTAEEGEKSVAAAKRKEAAAARKAEAEAEKTKTAEERAVALEAKADAADARVEKMRAKAEAMRLLAERARAEAAATSDGADGEEQATDEQEPETATEE
ncbi:MAG: hypothetical protein HDT28_01895 [Clostridiales bacterium]|nr:hypothetical protein [Clostridiales bacterium]